MSRQGFARSMPNKNALVAWLKKRRVALLKGGWSSERLISLKTGAAVENSFKRLGVRFMSIDVKPRVAHALQRKKIQFCFNALHGPFGEDGRLQAILDTLKIPYTGSGAVASAVAMDKDLSKKLFVAAGVPTDLWMTLSKNQFKNSLPSALKAFASKPVFVKPIDQGSAVGASRVDRPSELADALRASFQVSDRAMIERFAAGRELTVGILGSSALPVIEIRPQHEFYDFHSKYAPGGSRHLVPAPLPPSLAKKIQAVALHAFQSLGCEVYGRVDVILGKSGKLSVLEVNTIPGMTDTSLLPEAARARGISFDDLVLRIIDLSRKRYGA